MRSKTAARRRGAPAERAGCGSCAVRVSGSRSQLTHDDRCTVPRGHPSSWSSATASSKRRSSAPGPACLTRRHRPPFLGPLRNRNSSTRERRSWSCSNGGRTSTVRLGAVREVANLVPRVRAEHHPPHWPRRADAGDHAKLGAERETILVEARGRGTRSHERWWPTPVAAAGRRGPLLPVIQGGKA